ncbi:iron-hydroxamate transporter substrate-binding subunit [Klebsiella pneumoniae]|uniref:Iron-hydroxamate transporter substrate-binding subunit n=1 Tax=Klebsiella pneumoniae TaxID=573 RepID=A0A2X3D2G4_KLEPN|nr:iron-hydroxamate transporter substrate-binding subunit [Klebsiella pneumoniae]
MMNPTLITRRRLLIAMALSPLLWQMRGAQAADVDPQRVVALEWAARGAAAGARRDALWRGRYSQLSLVGERTRAARLVINVGLRTEPNLELLTQMKPSFIVWSAGYGPVAGEAGAYRAGRVSPSATANGRWRWPSVRYWKWPICWAKRSRRSAIWRSSTR